MPEPNQAQQFYSLCDDLKATKQDLGFRVSTVDVSPMKAKCPFTGCQGLGLRDSGMWILNPTWTPKVCKIIAFTAVILGLGLLFYMHLGFR